MAILYLDSGVLIEAAHVGGKLHEKAAKILLSKADEFIASEWLRLEVLGQPLHHRREPEEAFYEGYFQTAHHWPPELALKHWTDLALVEMKQYGLKPFDALHVVSAAICKADRLITTERRMKSMHRTRSVRVVSLSDS